MQIARSIQEIKALRKAMVGSVGLVPTMGYLHNGHLELVRQARQSCSHAIVSIFVNPTQFAPNEDFKSYPRDLDRDLALLESVKTDVAFVPPAEDMYPARFDTWVEVRGITSTLEGRSRPMHFLGVTTVCNKLFNIAVPDRAYFGQKDAQQALVICKMVADLNMNLEIVIVPTVREKDGLAMSSRNVYLTAEERSQAPVLYRALDLAAELYGKGERDAGKIREAMAGLISSVPAAMIDYISISDLDTLQDVDRIERKVLVSLAVKLGKPRLIDNIILG